jgi:hypothetical protein
MAEKPPKTVKPLPRPKLSVPISKTMERFLLELVQDGRAINPREAVRSMIWREMQRWAKEHGHPFPSYEDRIGAPGFEDDEEPTQ